MNISNNYGIANVNFSSSQKAKTSKGYEITLVETAQDAKQIADKKLAGIQNKLAVAGYTKAPEGYYDVAKNF